MQNRIATGGSLCGTTYRHLANIAFPARTDLPSLAALPMTQPLRPANECVDREPGGLRDVYWARASGRPAPEELDT